MSHSPREKSLTPSRQSPYSSNSTTLSNPFPSQAQPSYISHSPQSVFNQKLIPRDYLRSKSFTIPSPPIVATSRIIESPTKRLKQKRLKQKHSEPYLHDRSDSSCSGLRSLRTPPLLRNRKTTPDSDPLGHEDPSVVRTRSPEAFESPPSPFTSRAISKPDRLPPQTADDPPRPIMPRTSSIDSAISTVSNASLQKATGNVRNPSPSDIRDLIAMAGGAENLIAHLLKDKNNVASQNAQLWKLVEKQRALLLGLNKDLERITKERDRYKKKVKDVQVHVSGIARKASESPETKIPQPSIPEQEKVEDTALHAIRPQTAAPFQPKKISSPLETAMMPPPLATSQNEKGPPSIDSFSAASKELFVAEIGIPPRTSEEASPTEIKLDVSPIAEQERERSKQDEQQPVTFTVTTPTSEKSVKGLTFSRRAPPKPLNLAHSKNGSITSLETSAKSEITSGGETPERGRRRTRAEDERDRGLSAVQSEDTRSRSKKEKAIKASSVGPEHKAPPTDSTPGLPLSPRPQHSQNLLSPHFQPATNNVNFGERMLAGALKSPGLPTSPRPMHNSTAGVSLPMSPRANGHTFPLSPRAPKQPLPIPTNPAAPIDPAALQSTHHKMPELDHHSQGSEQPDRLHVHKPHTFGPPSIYRGLAVPAYPSLLLPPNALPSIQLKVASSRTRPPRHSMLGLKSQDESTVFSLSVISRSSNSELWRIEKIPSSLPQLEQQLKQHCSQLPKMPDRKIFTGQSPAFMDARKNAIDTYFDELLDTHINEQAAIIICKYLSSDVLDSDTKHDVPVVQSNDMQTQNGQRIIRTGYLTKKGKNFGGWKSRYFVLEGSELRYYENSGGSHLGTIRLQHSQIGKQRPDEYVLEDQDGHYRHAFLIQEPKRKDSTTFMRHVLCAENDHDRDEWVRLLLQHTESDLIPDSPKSKTEYVQVGVLPTLNERTVTITKDGQLVKDVHSSSPTPTTGSSTQDSPSNEYPRRETRPHAATISGPVNGGVISDPSTWGNKIVPHTAKETKDKSYKMSNIFSFKKNEHPTHTVPDSKPKPRVLRHNGYVRPVFGMPLAEAVEFCSPFNVEVNIPAVVYRSIEYLRFRNAANDEGLFRLSGSNTTVRMLKDRFNTEGDVDLLGEDEYHDVHAVASLFKTYLRELPSTLLTRDLHVEFVKVLELEQSSEKIHAFNILVHRLPHVNFTLLRALSQYLLEVTQMSDKNKMSVRNMGIVFSPTLNIPTPVFTLFLTEYEAIFERTADEVSRAGTVEVKSPPGVSSDEVRSPRQQTFSDISTPAHSQTSFPGLPANPHDKAPGTANLGDIGMFSVQPSYETGNYVSMPDAYTQPTQPTPILTEGGFNSLNGLLAPDNATSIKAKRRESAMIFGSK